LKKENLIRNI